MERITYVECFGAVASLAAALPLTGQVVNSGALRILHRLHRRRGLADELLGLLGGLLLLLSCGRDGLCYSLFHLAGDGGVLKEEVKSLPWQAFCLANISQVRLAGGANTQTKEKK